MEIDHDFFEKLTTQAQNEEKSRTIRVKDIENKWNKLEQRFGKP